jgi:DNA-directed RNA polymerase subunit RPC12/RpoP
VERFRYLGIFECRKCGAEEFFPRVWAMHLGDAARCMRCGTYRITRLREPDRIDKMAKGLLNQLERLAGGRLYHCRYCRVQFWDRRPLRSEVPEKQAAVVVTSPPEAAGSDG